MEVKPRQNVVFYIEMFGVHSVVLVTVSFLRYDIRTAVQHKLQY
jgi:hypothetical protein